MDGPKHDSVEISDEAREAYRINEAWKNAPDIEKKDPDGHFRALSLNPDVLESQNADEKKAAIAVAYDKQAKIHHPDLEGGNEEQMKKINAARDALFGKGPRKSA